MQKQILNGSMRPAMIEKRFDSEADKLDDFIFNLDGNMKMRIVGKIDRVDVDESEGDVFIQVVDYKSSSKKLDMDLIEAGVQLQLITYFSVAYEIEKQIYPDKNIRPAGLLYYTFNDPVVETTGKPQEEKEGFRLYADDDIEDKRLELLKLNGFVNSDKDIIKRMDKDFKHLSPVSGDKDGNIRKNKGVISEEKLLDLMNLAKENIQKLGDEIAAGDVTISPFTQKGENPCQYCDYKYICRYDEKVDTKSLKGELI
jgi:ATP-dependent helicase/nuclease subunit B